MYLGVVRIITIPDKNHNRVVIADSHTRTGKVIEYAVKMKHIASGYRMDKLLNANRIKLENIDKIASILNNFHSSTLTNKEIQKYTCFLLSLVIISINNLNTPSSVIFVAEVE
jgi:aminoglycoside phosphotransferase family enzyme